VADAFRARIASIRAGAREIRGILEERRETALFGFGDAEFWETLDRIEAAGERREAGAAPWLASLTQTDDGGPMGRDLFLSWAALAALARVPEAALAAGRELSRALPADASRYRKIGLCLALAASGDPAALPLIERFRDDPDQFVKQEARWMIAHWGQGPLSLLPGGSAPAGDPAAGPGGAGVEGGETLS
jgi:hypothetical protein